MNMEKAESAIIWTMDYLGFKLADHHKEEWVLEASEWTPIQWQNAIKSYYKHRDGVYVPMLKRITDLIKGEPESIVKANSINFVDSDAYDKSLTYEENYNNFLKWSE